MIKNGCYVLGVLCCLFFQINLNAQSNNDSIGIASWRFIQPDQANILPTHPIALFSTRKVHNFKFVPDRFSISVDLSNGNVMLPTVITHYPVNSSDRDRLAQEEWHVRDVNGMETQSEVINIDGLIRTLNLQCNIRLAAKHELSLGIRSMFFEKGAPPFTLFNSDDFVEFFHEKVWVISEPDPFARKIIGFYHSDFYYKNIEGKELEIEENQFLIPGVELSYYFYPNSDKKEKKRFFSNFGQHIGINTTEFNTSMDVGTSYAATKNWISGKRSFFNLSAGVSLFYHQLLKAEDAAHIYSKNLNAMAEGNIEYKWSNKSKPKMYSFALTYMIQSIYKSGYSDGNYGSLIFEGERYTSHWNIPGTHVFKPLQVWTLTYNFIKGNYIFSLYLQEDLLVNNAADTQTGVRVKFRF